MKRWALAILILIAIIVLCWPWLRPPPVEVPPEMTACAERAELQVSVWKQEGKTEAEINRLFQSEMARCSGVRGACAPFVGAVNVDYAWLGRQVLSRSLTPTDYLARVRDRSTKLRQTRQKPEICDAYQRGDGDGDLVPDENDRCPDTPNLDPTGADGCPDTRPLPLAPSAEAVSDAAKALKIPLTQACQPAPVPDSSAVLRAGLNPSDSESFLIEVTAVTNQPAGCPVFYEVEIRIRNSSLFSGTLTQESVRRVFRPADAVPAPPAAARAFVYQLRRSDPIPWDALVRPGIEPSDHAIKNLRVRSVNGNGSSAGWSAFRTREFRPNNRNFQ